VSTELKNFRPEKKPAAAFFRFALYKSKSKPLCSKELEKTLKLSSFGKSGKNHRTEKKKEGVGCDNGESWA